MKIYYYMMVQNVSFFHVGCGSSQLEDAIFDCVLFVCTISILLFWTISWYILQLLRRQVRHCPACFHESVTYQVVTNPQSTAIPLRSVLGAKCDGGPWVHWWHVKPASELPKHIQTCFPPCAGKLLANNSRVLFGWTERAPVPEIGNELALP